MTQSNKDCATTKNLGGRRGLALTPKRNETVSNQDQHFSGLLREAVKDLKFLRLESIEDRLTI